MARCAQACCIFLALFTSYASGSRQSSVVVVTVDIFNDAGVASSVLRNSELEAGRIFRAAHIDIRWRDCTPAQGRSEADPACRVLRSPSHLTLRIVPGSKEETRDIFGTAFLAADGTGCYSDVFYGSVEKLRSQRHDVGRVLGYVMAHEIGHLLIGSHAHSPWGIMCANWHDEQLRLLEMGNLLFTAEQEKKIHSHLEEWARNSQSQQLGAGRRSPRSSIQ